MPSSAPIGTAPPRASRASPRRSAGSSGCSSNSRSASRVASTHRRGAAREVEQRHFDRRMRARIADEPTFERAAERRAHPGILAGQCRRQLLAYGGVQSAERIAGHRQGGRRLAPADGSVGRLDPHQKIFRVLDGDAGHRHGLCERQRDRDRVHPADSQRRPLRGGILCNGSNRHPSCHGASVYSKSPRSPLLHCWSAAAIARAAASRRDCATALCSVSASTAAAGGSGKIVMPEETLMVAQLPSAAARLRGVLEQDGLLIAPGAYDCISARTIEHAGFSAVYMTGAGTAATLGYPDYGLLSMSEMAENAGRLAAAVKIPVIADADTGY